MNAQLAKESRATGDLDVPVVAIEDAHKRFGATQALQGADLFVQPGRSHALLGRNGAGKSTLVAAMTGLITLDQGRVTFSGQPAPDIHDRHAWRRIVACVYQKSTLVSQLSVGENMFLNRWPRRGVMGIDWRSLYAQADELLKQWNLDVDPRVRVDSLKLEQRQLVELARSLSTGSRYIILDEPTAELEGREISRLFDKVNALQEQGITFLYISHHLEEIYEVCKDMTILRDGRTVMTGPVEGSRKRDIVAAMVGDSAGAAVGKVRTGRTPKSDRPMLEVRGLSIGRDVTDVSLSVRPGEVLGLAGLAGSGKALVADVLSGLLLPDTGEVSVDGRPVPLKGPKGMIDAGISLVPQERHFNGFVPGTSIEENATMSILDRLATQGLIRQGQRRETAEALKDRLNVKANSVREDVSDLSGGNQQKVVFARALANAPKVLVLVTPTSGVDIASNESLFDSVDAAARDGAATLIVSDDLDELAVCDRVQVIFKGRLGDCVEAGWDAHTLVEAIEGISEHSPSEADA